ncbi:prophage tail length tape measure family protein [Delftia acidovorans]|uniref:phage tail length tape measure family protein n=1 Tax=Delftia acidovorans TaxID=80866 RepID=UPI000504B8B4|nr:phage tail length tape measure family protein [Delftia acidovorans]KFJ09597.1 prophage tail length tape measure family protein [Delftia acidovorans]QQB52587.1 phage tail length tape measure family protein [Delftia acidovorans]
MEEQNRKIGFVVSAEDDTKTTFQNIKTGAADMAASVAKSGEQAAKGVKGIGDGADEAAQKMGRAESAMAQALTRATEKAQIAAQAGESLSRAFEQKIEMRGLDVTKLNPLVAKLREAEEALASFKAQQAKDAGQSSFLESLRSQTQALGKTKAELLELQAAQLGVASQAAPYIAKLRETEAGMGRVGNTAAQTAQAMRMVPAQFTDIVVSLQAGQAPLTVLLQQGGQLKDMFGGAGAAARGMAGYVVGLVNPFTVAAAAAATLGVAYYQGSKESDNFRRSLVLSGNQAGTTVDELNAMARAIASTSGTQGAAAAGLADMARYSKVASDQLKDFTAIALQWEKTTGQAVSETAKQFADLAKDPLQASLALNEQMNYLTASIYDQIKALEKQGKTAEAAAVAQKAYADAMKTGADELTQNLGYIERAVQIVTGGAKKMWDAILGVGRQTSPTDQAAKHLEALQQELNTKLAQGPKNEQSRTSWDKGVENLKRQIQQATDFLAFAGAAGKSIAETQAANKEYVDAMEDFDKLAGQFATKDVKRKQELTIAQNTYNKSVEETKRAYANTPELASKLADLETRYKNAVEGINKRYTEKGSGGISISDNQLANLEGQLAAAKQYREQLLTLGVAAADLNVGERESLKLSAQIEKATNAKTRAKLEEAKALADALGVQLRSNDGLEKSMKVQEALIAGNFKAADSITDRAREQEAANAVFGKGRTEIERMTLATLQQQMAEAQGSDSFDPKYIASLEAKIAAQKRYTAALQQADYKQMDDRLTKSLQTSKDELAIQKEGLSLLGADEVQRKKIIAQRRIELELAKELAEIDRTIYSDDKDENDKKRETLRQKAREKAETNTQTSLLRIQEEYVNKQVEQYDEIFRKGFADMLNNGRDGWDSFTKSLTTTFKTTVADQIYKMFLRPFVVQVVASLLGVQGGGGAGASGLSGVGGGGSGGFSIPGLPSMGGSYFNAGMAGGWAGFEGGISMMQAGEWAAGGMQALGAAAPYIGALLQIGQGKYGSGVGMAAGAYIGSIVPVIGTAIGALIGGIVGGLFDGGARGPNHSGGVASTGTTDRDLAVKQVLGTDAWGNTLTDFTDRGNKDLDKQLDKTVKGMLDLYKSLAKIGGVKARDIDIAAGFSVNPKYGDEGAMGFFQLLDKQTGEVLKKYKNRDLDKDPQKAWAQFVADMGGELVNEIKKGDIPGWMKEELDAIGENVTLEGLNAAIQKIAIIDVAFKGWADSVTGFANLTAKAQTELLKFAGGIEALASGVNAFYAGFYSEQERALILQRQVRDQLKKLGIDIDPAGGEAAKKAFRKLIEDALASGNNELAAKLLALAQLFGVAADAAQKSADTAAEAAKTAGDEAAKAVEDARKKAKDAAYANFEAAIQREQKYWQDVASASQEAISSLSSALSTLRSNARDLYGSLDATQQMLAAQGMVYIEDALSGVRGGRKLTDYAGLTDAIGAARGGINSGRYATQFERDRDALVLAGQLSELADKGDAQLSAEERQLKASQEQLERLDKTLTYWRDQLADNKAQIDATLSVEDAVKALHALIPGSNINGGGTGQKPGSSGGAVWGPGGGGSTAADPKYVRPRADGSGGTWYEGITDPGRVAELDKLAGGYHKFDGTGDAAGLNAWIRENNLKPQDLADLSGLYARDWDNWFKANGIPAFAGGGLFGGGLRLVGERGPELEVTGPARYWSSAQTQALLSGAGGNSRLESLVEQLVAENRLMRGQIAALERNTAGMPQMAEQFDTVAESGVLRVGTV